MNSHRQAVLVTIVVLVASVLSQPCAQQVNAQDLRMPGVRVERSMLCTLQPGQPVFADILPALCGDIAEADPKPEPDEEEEEEEEEPDCE